MPKRTEKTAIIGLGYVGLPLLLDFCSAGINVVGFDIDESKIRMLSNGESYISYIPSDILQKYKELGKFEATSDMSQLSEANNIIITVPTPLSDHREPDLSFVRATTEVIAKHLRSEQLVILESTTYPGTTSDVMLPILEQKGMTIGKDFYLAYSPERVDPNDKNYSAREIPKVVGGITENCLKRVKELYENVFTTVVPVSSVEVAEASKLLENIFRSVNIALVNEIKMLFDRMDIDTYEVINASATKPYGFMPFYPGPGLGGHCIPIDPFYLTWKAREYDFSTRFIELAGEINTRMPYFIVEKTIDALNRRGKSIKEAEILVLGVAYKKDVDDTRESPALKIIKILEEKGAQLSYHDPYVPFIKGLRQCSDLYMQSIPLNEESIKTKDCLIIVTDHSCIDYCWIHDMSNLIVDTRNVFSNYQSEKIVKA